MKGPSLNEKLLTVGEANAEYLIGPALRLAVTVVKFLQGHFGVNKAYVCLQLVLDGFYILEPCPRDI